MECRGSQALSLLEFIGDYKERKFIVPNWQRGDVWTKEKKREWNKTVLNGCDKKIYLPGCVVLYALVGSEQKYINDGLQRKNASEELYDNILKEEGMEAAYKIFNNVKITVQEFIYESHDEAVKYYLIINNGTGFTSHELTSVIFTTLDNYEQWRDNVLYKIHDIMNKSVTRLKIKVASNRDNIHKNYRDNLSLFYCDVSRKPIGL